jgi:hypothetical protein
MQSGPSKPQTRAAHARRPWERPRILSREPLEAVAAVCAPSPPAKGNPGLCASGPISS